METVQQNGRFTLFSSKFLSIYSILYGQTPFFAMFRREVSVNCIYPVPKADKEMELSD